MEELKNELKALEEQKVAELKASEQKAREERLAKMETEKLEKHNAMISEYNRWMESIAKAINNDKLTFTAKILKDIGWDGLPKVDCKITHVDGTSVSVYISFDRENTSTSSWRPKHNGRYRIVAGDFGNRKSYPQRKDGEFDWENIAYRLVSHFSERYYMDKRQQTINNNRKLITDLLSKYQINSYSQTASASTDQEKPVAMELKMNVTIEQADKILEALQQLGIKVS